MNILSQQLSTVKNEKEDSFHDERAVIHPKLILIKVRNKEAKFLWLCRERNKLLIFVSSLTSSINLKQKYLCKKWNKFQIN